MAIILNGAIYMNLILVLKELTSSEERLACGVNSAAPLHIIKKFGIGLALLPKDCGMIRLTSSKTFATLQKDW